MIYKCSLAHGPSWASQRTTHETMGVVSYWHRPQDAGVVLWSHRLVPWGNLGLVTENNRYKLHPWQETSTLEPGLVYTLTSTSLLPRKLPLLPCWPGHWLIVKVLRGISFSWGTVVCSEIIGVQDSLPENLHLCMQNEDRKEVLG